MTWKVFSYLLIKNSTRDNLINLMYEDVCQQLFVTAAAQLSGFSSTRRSSKGWQQKRKLLKSWKLLSRGTLLLKRLLKHRYSKTFSSSRQLNIGTNWGANPNYRNISCVSMSSVIWDHIVNKYFKWNRFYGFCCFLFFLNLIKFLSPTPHAMQTAANLNVTVDIEVITIDIILFTLDYVHYTMSRHLKPLSMWKWLCVCVCVFPWQR